MTSEEVSNDDQSRPAAERGRQQSRLLLVELSAVIALTIADAFGLVPLSRTPFLLLLCWVSLRWRRLKWRDVGFTPAPRLTRAVMGESRWCGH